MTRKTRRLLLLLSLGVLLGIGIPIGMLIHERPGTWTRRLPHGLRTRLLGTDAYGNDWSAAGTLRLLHWCQEESRKRILLDLDGDGVPEYLTIGEMTGCSGIRTNADGSTRASQLDRPMLSPVMARYEADGTVYKAGYLFRLYLPGVDDSPVMETRPECPLTGPAQVDMSETHWWAIAWPREWGRSGECAFLIDGTGTVYKAENEQARYSGLGRAPDIVALVRALGDPEGEVPSWVGPDGETWRVF